ncbi:gamma-glutamyl-gamma-aminobutyrate hydrolase family protein [Actinomycetospora endophytica]|uniref:Gamma-glutamyl-gamma-aminobutyrate hydrolase family protein n=1 Tax=Actinomycetospora endophytica TaxID=2291215 RepID=A0ABS8PBV8_9PSEU|nr:gamma-glutamyl-gamma-aminobutyrate hydrolase family protein [Actinomycetospora endophytica]MCD2195765.1 gamma-glutamyl-gamma-aminobutyrate hydrolase family protein [Actinomycetospora endophytica]
MTPPLVGVSGRRRGAAGAHDGPAALDVLQVEVYFTGYADRLAEAGALPVHLPARADPGEVMSRMDALVLTGGSDVDPALYGQEALPSVRVDRARDDRELALLAAALERDVPVLAICRGMQLLAVHLGGTLVQHLESHPLGRDDTHEVRFAAGSVVHGIYGGSYRVNSLHHQAVAEPGAGLVCVGHAPDGVVEAVELPGRDVVGVQWHPEQLRHADPVFAWLTRVAMVKSSR